MCVMDSPALQTQRAVFTTKFAKSFATWQHRFVVDLNFLSYPAPLSLWYYFTQNVSVYPLVVVIIFPEFYLNPFSIRAKGAGHSENR